MLMWTYPFFGCSDRTSAEDERDLRRPGRTEVWKAELQIFGSKDRTELQKQNVRPLNVLHIRADVRKLNFISLAVKAEQKFGSGTSHLWKSRQS